MLPFIHQQCIRANEAANIVYLNNPKVGCSTVKANLWRILSPQTFHDEIDVHDIEASPFSNALAHMDWLSTARIFTFVRNPFTRLVSAYLNKIHGKEPGVWEWFVRQYELPNDADISFDAFIEIIASDSPEFLDPHWRPQHLNVMFPFVKPNFVGHLEQMDADLPKVLSRFLDVQIEQTPRKNVHRTGADDRARSYFDDPATMKRFKDLYRLDFEYFGYSDDINRTVDVRFEVSFNENKHPALDALARFRRSMRAAERLEIVESLEPMLATEQDRMVSSWLIHSKLENSLDSPDDCMQLIQENLEKVTNGYEYLRRTAGRISAANGKWGIVRLIADAALRKSVLPAQIS